MVKKQWLRANDFGFPRNGNGNGNGEGNCDGKGEDNGNANGDGNSDGDGKTYSTVAMMTGTQHGQ
jgi:hypothetical protein